MIRAIVYIVASSVQRDMYGEGDLKKDKTGYSNWVERGKRGGPCNQQLLK